MLLERKKISGCKGHTTEYDDEVIPHINRWLQKMLRQWKQHETKCIASEGDYFKDD